MTTRLAAKARKIADHDGVAALGPSSMGFRTPTPDEKQSLLQFCTGICQGYASSIDYEHTQSTKAGAPGVDPGQLITESRLFPQRQTDVATGAPCCDRKVNADRVLFGRKHRLKCCQNRGIEPTQGRGVRTTPASTRGHMWMGARTRTHELIGANRS